MNVTDEDGPRRRFDVELFVVHPTIDPLEITAALGLEPSAVHRAGDRRTTPKGTLLEGVFPDTRWRHSIRREAEDQYFTEVINDFVNRLLPHEHFLHHLRATGGRPILIVQFLGDWYFGDEITRETLAKIVDLQLDWGIECFAEPQNSPHPDSPGLASYPRPR